MEARKQKTDGVKHVLSQIRIAIQASRFVTLLVSIVLTGSLASKVEALIDSCAFVEVVHC